MMGNETDTVSISSDVSDSKKIDEPKLLYNTHSISSIVSDVAGSESHSLFRPLSNFIEQVKLDNKLTEVESQHRVELEPNDALGQLIRNDEEKQLSQKSSHGSQELPIEEDIPPDGGYGWVCCACYMVFNASTWGVSSSFGVFLAYYLETDYFKGATATDFALIGGIIVGAAQILAPFILLLVKLIGFKQTLILGTTLQTIGLLLASFATKTWQLFLTQGVIVGFSFSLLFIPSSLIIQNWFYHKRSLVGGIGTSGSGIGGLIFSLAANKLIITTGNHKWALRMIAIITCCTCSIATFLIRLRKTPQNTVDPNMPKKELIRTTLKVLFDKRVLHSLPTQLIGMWFALYTMAYVIILFSLSAYGRSIGLSESQASNMTTFINVAQLVGRPIIGFSADRFGRVNMSISLTILIAILIFAFWLNCFSYASLTCFALICGLIMGCGQVNYNSMLAEAVPSDLYPASFAYCIVIAGILGVPSEMVGLNLRFSYLDNPYLWCQIISAVIYLLSVLFLIPYREWKVRKLLRERHDLLERSLESCSSDDDEDTREKFNSLRNYEKLLQSDFSHYMLRLVYPIKA